MAREVDKRVILFWTGAYDTNDGLTVRRGHTVIDTVAAGTGQLFYMGRLLTAP